MSNTIHKFIHRRKPLKLPKNTQKYTGFQAHFRTFWPFSWRFHGRKKKLNVFEAVTFRRTLSFHTRRTNFSFSFRQIQDFRGKTQPKFSGRMKESCGIRMTEFFIFLCINLKISLRSTQLYTIHKTQIPYTPTLL